MLLSIPIFLDNFFFTFIHLYYTMFLDDYVNSFAGIAQLVEHRLPKARVAGSSPVSRSILKNLIDPKFILKFFYY